MGQLETARKQAGNLQLSDLMWRVRNLDLPANDVASAEKHLKMIIAAGSGAPLGAEAGDELQLILDNRAEVRRRWTLEVESVLKRESFGPERGEEAYTNARRILKTAPSWAYPIKPFIPRFVRSDPPGAMILLDGMPMGHTPRIVEMPADAPARLVLSLPGGYENASRMVSADAPFEVNMSLGRPIRWRLELDGCVSAPITVVDGVAYCCAENGLVAAVDTKNGKLLWSTHPARPDKTPLFSPIPYAPAASARHVVAATVYDGAFVLDRATGAVIRHLGDIQEISAPPVFSTDGSLCFVTGDDGYLYTYETTRFAQRGGYLDLDSKVLGAPVFDGSYLLVCTFGGKCLVVDTELSTIVKSIDLKSPITFGPINLRDRILAVSHRADTPILYTVKLVQEDPRRPSSPEGVIVTGKQERMGRTSATPTYIPDALYIPSSAGRVAAMSVGGPKVDVLWVETLGTGPISAIAVADVEDLCYAVDGSGRLHAFSRTRGEVQWSISAPTGFTSPPAVAPNGVIVCGADAVLYMLEFK
jgi:outer membrane protein assembly factor BamB